MDALELPFHFLRVPNFRLRIPSFSLPSPMTVFALVFLSYYLVFSGIIYDVIVEPPSIGSHQDPSGAVKPLAFLQYRDQRAVHHRGSLGWSALRCWRHRLHPTRQGEPKDDFGTQPLLPSFSLE
jgi:hypothetical protein